MSTNEINISAIRLRACAIAPYLSAALYNMHLIVIESEEMKTQIPTMGIDRYWRCYINPDFVEEIGVKIAANIFIHEVYHLISDHCGRAVLKSIVTPEGKDAGTHIIWNIAGDMAINQDLKHMGLTLPEDSWYPAAINEPDGELIEYYYDKLMEKVDVIDCSAMQNEGSGASGLSAEWEKGERDGEAHEKVGNEKGKILRRKVAQDIKTHSKSQGNVPAGLERWADEILDPKVDWLTKFNSALRGQITKQAGMVDFTYSRPSRRAGCFTPFIFPKMVKPIPEVAVLLDTSGSMSNEDLAASIAEVRGILDSLGTPITVYSADTQVHAHQNVWSIDDIEMLGGGGTDMGKSIDQVAEEASPDILIVITDGMTPWRSEKPVNIDSVIAIITQPGYADQVPDFIETVEIEL